MSAILDDRDRVGISHMILKTKYYFGTILLAEDFNVIFSDNQYNRLQEKPGIYV
jgi:hypothetical protein